MASTRCSYSHDVSEDTRFPELDDTWRCPRKTVSEADYCLFHTSATHAARRHEDVSEAFLNSIESPNESAGTGSSSQTRFIGVTLPALELSHHVLQGETTHPIDLRDATVRGDVDLQHAEISFPILFDGATIRGQLELQSAKLNNRIRARDATISGGINADDTTFTNSVIIEDTQIRGPIVFREASCEAGLSLQNCSVTGKCVLHGADIEGPLRFTDTVFRSPLNLERVVVTEDATFDRMDCRRSIRVTGATFHGLATFGDIQVGGSAQFTRATFNEPVELTAARFADRCDFRRVTAPVAIFDNASFDGPARFDETEVTTASYVTALFNGDTRFTEITAHKELDLRSVTINGSLRLDDADVNAIAIEDTDVNPHESCCIILLEGSTITSGTVEIQANSLYYDASHATLGDITLFTQDEEFPLFEGILLDNTTFDGFDFSTVESDLRDVQWQLHTTTNEFPAEPPEYTTREKTYLKGKNGAEHVGATRAAAEFFRRELINRRYAHYERARSLPFGSKDWAATWYQWLTNRVFEISAGYGERPRATIKTTLITIGVFAGVYWLLLPSPPYDIGVIGYLFFSLASFVTLVFGGVSTPSNPVVHFLALFEGLIGAFLIALFVFTLTRSVHR